MPIDPQQAFTEGTFVTALTGVAGLARIVRELAAPAGTGAAADDFVYLLLGVASLGAAVERLVPPPAAAGPADGPTPQDWLR